MKNGGVWEAKSSKIVVCVGPTHERKGSVWGRQSRKTPCCGDGLDLKNGVFSKGVSLVEFQNTKNIGCVDRENCGVWGWPDLENGGRMSQTSVEDYSLLSLRGYARHVEVAVFISMVSGVAEMATGVN